MAKRKATPGAEDEWETPSAFNKLLKRLKKSSKKNAQKEDTTHPGNQGEYQNTLQLSKERLGLDDENNAEQDTLPDDSLENEEWESDGSMGADNDELDDTVESDNESTSDEIDHLEDSEGLESSDVWERHFGNHVSDDLIMRAALVDKNEWQSRSREDPVLSNVVEKVLPGGNADGALTSPLSWDNLHVKQRLAEPWKKVNASSTGGRSTNELFTSLQAHMLPYVNSYKDILYTNLTHSASPELQRLYALHAINHIYKTRDRVLKNTTKLKADTSAELELRDQGFTRPKVLILLPFKSAALEVVKHFIALSGTNQQDNKKRFFDEFGVDPDEEKLDQEKRRSKPADHKLMFAGNIDDCFRVGIKFARKQMKLFAPFYSSDIIIASPLGLRMVIGSEGDKKRDFDFLSAIELVILDHTDVFLMQNWEHTQHIFEHLNLIPKDPHGCDFSRVRSYYLDGKAKYVRQTIILSKFLSPQINALFNKWCKNGAGKVRIGKFHGGTISDVLVQVPQTFYRVPSSTPTDADDVRFQFFVDKILPSLRQSIVQQKHTMIFVPSYFDFVRLRNWLNEHNWEFAALSEYTPTNEIARVRGQFFRGSRSYLLYTERMHFFRRYRIKGVKHVVFYGLPDNAEYYPELLNMVEQSADGKCTVLFNHFDRLKLERIVGSKRVQHMVKGEKEAWIFT
ncbi:hypothetical protein BC832DRAFT_560139 [Gaertneriomyces semiglobifer]|nr:hypothetical protein BC832DRAFT_560139 [Gaertneriomyces semiglobifer]